MSAPYLSAAELAVAYRGGELTPTAAVEAALARLEALKPRLNAFATVLAEDALDAAARATRELAAGVDRGPLHGVPVAVKDLVSVAGVPTGFGSRVGRVARADSDAEVVARLRAAGAVLLGTTNLLEYAYGAVHPAIGATRNPHDLSRTSGGSSGGSAAAVAAGIVPLALGTDTGGSIRIPASYCGVVGLKPSYGTVPMRGVFPLSWTLDHVGPLARSAADAGTLLATIAAGERAAGRGAGSRAPALRGARIGVPRAYTRRVELEPAVAAALGAAEQALQEAGATLVEADFDGLELANEALPSILYPEASVLHEQYIRATPEGYAPATRAQIELGFAIPATVYLRALQARRALTEAYDRHMHGLDALLTPAVNTVAPAEDPVVSGSEGAAEMHFSGPFNVVGAPAVAVPFNAAPGLPVGLQLAAARGDDARLLQLADALAALAPTRPPRPPLEPA